MLKNINVRKNSYNGNTITLKDKQYFAIIMFTAATCSMSDDTSGYDEDLPNFDKNTLENILMLKISDADDMRKLDKLIEKMLNEMRFRANACKAYLETEQKL